MAVNYGSLPFLEALAFFRAKLNLPTRRWDDLLGAAHDRAFVVAGATKADLLMDLRAAVDQAIAQGTTWATFRKDFRKIVAERGWTGWTGEGTKAGEAWRTRVIYDTNLFTSYSAGRYQQMKAVAEFRPYWRYRHSDAVVHPRQEHLAWNGKILRHNDEWWRQHAPPSGFGCRCFVETLADRDLKKLGIAPPTADAGKAMPYAGMTDPKTGLPLGVDKGWDYQPGANRTTPLYDLIARKLPKMDAALGAAMWAALKDALAMEQQLAWGDTLDEWLADEFPRGKTAIVGALPPTVLAWLSHHGKPIPITAEIAIHDSLPKGPKQARHEADQNGWTLEEWRALPTLLGKPGAVYFDKHSGKLIFVADGLGPAKAAIEFDPKKLKKGTMNWVVSAFRVSDEAVAGAVKGGEWDIVQ